MVTEHHQNRISQGAKASRSAPPSTPCHCGIPLRSAPQHQNSFLPPARGLALGASLSFSIAQLKATPLALIPMAKLSSHHINASSCPPLLYSPPASSRTTLLPGVWKRIQIRELFLFQSFLHTNHCSVSLFLHSNIPDLHWLKYQYHNHLRLITASQPTSLSLSSSFLKYNLICHCRFWLSTEYISTIPKSFLCDSSVLLNTDNSHESGWLLPFWLHRFLSHMWSQQTKRTSWKLVEKCTVCILTSDLQIWICTLISTGDIHTEV